MTADRCTVRRGTGSGPQGHVIVDARVTPPVITTLPGAVVAPRQTLGIPVRGARRGRVVAAGPVRVLPGPRPVSRRLAAAVAAGTVADAGVLGAAGWFAGQSAAGQRITALVLGAVAVAGGVLLVGLSKGTVHCPGCPR